MKDRKLTDFHETREAVLQNQLKHKPKKNKKKDERRERGLPTK